MFIVFDGVDGAGKTTQSKKLAQYFEARGKRVTWTRQPGGAPVAERIRALLLSSKPGEEPAAITELLLHAAARAEHVERVIRPALASGDIVICDRYIDSTYAYQGAGGGLDDARIADSCRLATGGLEPDFTFIFDIADDEAKRRMRARDGNAAKNRYERENSAFYARVAECYRKRARNYGDKGALIDASGDEDTVFKKVMATMDDVL